MLQAARDLYSRIRSQPWVSTVGQGDGRLVIYVSRMPVGKECDEVPTSYAGHPVSLVYATRPSGGEQ